MDKNLFAKILREDPPQDHPGEYFTQWLAELLAERTKQSIFVGDAGM